MAPKSDPISPFINVSTTVIRWKKPIYCILGDRSFVLVVVRSCSCNRGVERCEAELLFHDVAKQLCVDSNACVHDGQGDVDSRGALGDRQLELREVCARSAGVGFLLCKLSVEFNEERICGALGGHVCDVLD